MKTCPQCGQTYYDETNFCLNDGATLVASSTAPTVSQIEMPTVIRSAPAIIPIDQSFQQPFQQPFQQAFPAQPPQTESGGGSGLLYFVVGLILLVIVGAGVGLGIYFLSGPSNGPTETVNKSKTDSGATAGKTDETKADNDNKKDELDDEKEKLKAEQEKLDLEKKRLEDERKALEAKKKMTPLPTIQPPVDNSRTAYVIDPPSNIRATPNGRIICVVRGLNTPVRILGSTGVRDSNGLWYITDACGSRGVIHSTQIRF
ncbi:MAG: hypothetical protein IPN69_21780 [Acidobacteria bacterium]|nr:hypothetical protein [Acidobacteriota bacterium]